MSWLLIGGRLLHVRRCIHVYLYVSVTLSTCTAVLLCSGRLYTHMHYYSPDPPTSMLDMLS